MPQVGDTIWIFDENRRVYARDASGKMFGAAIWREHWRPTKITGETKVSWVTRDGMKINKKKPGGNVALDEAAIDRACYVKDNRHRIGVAVQWCDDYGIR
jgi:hypothetical protein